MARFVFWRLRCILSQILGHPNAGFVDTTQEGDGMHTRLRRIIVPPPFSEENTARMAALLTTILRVSLTVCIGYLLIMLLVNPNLSYLVFVGSMCFVLLLLLAAVRRGHAVAASWLFSIGALTSLVLSYLRLWRGA